VSETDVGRVDQTSGLLGGGAFLVDPSGTLALIDETYRLGMEPLSIRQVPELPLTARLGCRDDQLVEFVVVDELFHRREPILTEQARTRHEIDVLDPLAHPFEIDRTRIITRTNERPDVHRRASGKDE